MNLFGWLERRTVSRALKNWCKRRYKLRSTTWNSRSPRTPPYACCYNIPKGWLEGEAGDHVVTFWGEFGDGFTGDVMVGAFDAYWNRTISWSDGKVVRHADKGDPCGKMPPLLKLEALLEADPAFERLGVSFKALNLKFNHIPGPLLHSVIDLSVSLVDLLLPRGEPALLKAAKAGEVKQARALLDSGANPDEFGPELRAYAPSETRRYENHDRPLWAAIMNDHAELVALLLSHGADVKSNPNYILWIALENGRHGALKALFAGGFKPSPWELPYVDDFPLPFAASKGDLEAVRILLEAGLDPKQKRQGYFNSAWDKAEGPRKDEIRRLLKEAEEREEQAGGRLALAPSADGAELSKAEKE